MSEPLVWQAAESGARLDKALAEAFPTLSRTQVQRLIAAGEVTLNGQVVLKVSHVLTAGERIAINMPPPVPSELEPEAIPLAVVYEDDDVLVINKAAGMVVHPATSGHWSGTLVHAVLAHVPALRGVGGEQRPGIVHRLDKGTSGVMVVAKHDQAQRNLQEQFKARTVLKIYFALVEGRLSPVRGRIDLPLGRDPHKRERMAVVARGRAAVTLYRVLGVYAVGGRTYSLVRCKLLTGRTHQIRVHLTALGCPLVGDALYRQHTTPIALERPFLHAARLGFHLPSTGEWREFEAPLPDDLRAALAEARQAEVGGADIETVLQS